MNHIKIEIMEAIIIIVFALAVQAIKAKKLENRYESSIFEKGTSPA